MTCETIGPEYRDMVAAAKKKWDESSDEYKEGWHNAIATEVAGFLLWWDTLKEIEKRYRIDVWTVAKELRWKWSYSIGQSLAKGYEERNLKDLYTAYLAQFECACDMEYSELNDEVIAWRCKRCPCYSGLQEAGKTKEEIKELADLFCLMDVAAMNGFNPEFEVFPQPRLLMSGDEHCSYRVEYHKGKK